MYKLLKNNSISSQRGVSIAELAIVIAVIGLLLAIVSEGVKMRQASELRSMMSDISGFRVAIEGFQEKYRDLPGDMTDAYDYWGTACDSVAANCNGNGNLGIELSATVGADSESYRAWQHLNLAGFIEGGYTGVGTGANGMQADPGINAPATKRAQGEYHIRTHTLDTVTVAGTNIAIGAFIVGTWSAGALLTPSEVFAIDSKMDDGLPDGGKVKGRTYYSGGWQTACITGVAPNRTYITTSTNTECVIYFDIKQ